ncbi:hypothetical protein CC2G_002432 [Coprinopsis cinerea AmutBmut pab1-1]|nr:hypothetical protein CC2G_002432 [Coprinopsis cinerea AmutBmut pab1-1]
MVPWVIAVCNTIISPALHLPQPGPPRWCKDEDAHRIYLTTGRIAHHPRTRNSQHPANID